MIFEWDDFGSTTVISDQCQTHDCRDALAVLKRVNPKFKATLFTVPASTTIELLEWSLFNRDWIELAVHGWDHHSNYECVDWTKSDCFHAILHPVIQKYFIAGFRAPGWQISDACYTALREAGYWVADQAYNNDRRPTDLPAYVNDNGQFYVMSPERQWESWGVEAHHGHAWDCVGNGIYETLDSLKDLVSEARSFQFISEVLHGQ